METCENICWQYKNDLKHLYSLKEIDEFIRMAFLKLSDWNRIDVSLNKKTIIITKLRVALDCHFFLIC